MADAQSSQSAIEVLRGGGNSVQSSQSAIEVLRQNKKTPNGKGTGSSAAANNASITPGIPAAVAVGDLMVCAVYSRQTAGSVSITSGWTNLVNDLNSSGLLAVWYRFYQSGDAAPTITPSGASAGDTIIGQIGAWANVSSVNPFDFRCGVSSNGSQQNIGPIAGSPSAIRDLSNSAHTATATTDVADSAITAKFTSETQVLDQDANWAGGNSVRLAGTLTDFAFGTGAFTIEGWFWFDGANTNSCLFSCWTNSVWAFWINGGTLDWRANGVDTGAAWTPSAGWHHMCVERNGSSLLRIYVDGVVVASATRTDNLGTPTGGCDIGTVAGFGTWTFKGYIGDCRITKGVARYNGAFTPPTSAFPVGSANDASWSSVVALCNWQPAGNTAQAGEVVVCIGGKASSFTSVTGLTSYAILGHISSALGNSAGLCWDYLVEGQGGPFNIAAETFTVTGGSAAVGKGEQLVFRGAVLDAPITDAGMVPSSATVFAPATAATITSAGEVPSSEKIFLPAIAATVTGAGEAPSGEQIFALGVAADISNAGVAASGEQVFAPIVGDVIAAGLAPSAAQVFEPAITATITNAGEAPSSEQIVAPGVAADISNAGIVPSDSVVAAPNVSAGINSSAVGSSAAVGAPTVVPRATVMLQPRGGGVPRKRVAFVGVPEGHIVSARAVVRLGPLRVSAFAEVGREERALRRRRAAIAALVG